MNVLTETKGDILLVTLNRPEARNAVDRETARALAEAFRKFDGDTGLRVAVLSGAGGNFCAGADLKAMNDPERRNLLDSSGDGPMGPTRMRLSKPVLAAVSGYAVAGGLELALWCDMRVVERSAVFGVFCRRWGVPLIDGGTVRLPRLIGFSRAMDMILTGRAVGAEEALSWGLANRIVDDGMSLGAAVGLAEEIARFPQTCMRNDRLSAFEADSMDFEEAITNEFRRGIQSISSGEIEQGVGRFTSGKGRHGSFS